MGATNVFLSPKKDHLACLAYGEVDRGRLVNLSSLINHMILTLSTELRVAKAEFPFSVVLPSAIVWEQLVLPWISWV